MRSNIFNDAEYKLMANSIRFLAMDAVEHANSGHPGLPMGMADVATILFADFLKFNPLDAHWPDRDRFILSAGHGSMLLYALLYLSGYPDITLADIKAFRTLGCKTAGHPEYGYLSGIETTTGPLGQGFANAVGMAIAERILSQKFSDIIDHYTYVIAGDGCLMEGISYEAASLAGHLALSKLIVLFDDNQISIDGPTSLTTSENQLDRFKAANWHVQAIDGHDYQQIRQAIKAAKESDKPSLIACRTIIAYGAPTKSGSSKSHGSPLGSSEIIGTRKNLNWPYEAFEIPEHIMQYWQQIRTNSAELYQDWQRKFAAMGQNSIEEFNRRIQQELPSNFQQLFDQFKQEAINRNQPEASRKSSGRVIELLTNHLPELIGGSADLSESNNTKSPTHKIISKNDFAGQYLYYGVREHSMAAIMNGLALHKGVIPFGGTFLVFSDYCRPAIRLSALMAQRVIYIMTHDSIALGEDGPTHQPIEHLASLRAIPNLLVFRPADIIETAESWQIALEHKNGPSLLALSRQNLPLIRNEVKGDNLSQRGAYLLRDAKGQLDVSIFATGSEVAIALKVQEVLQQKNIGTRVISVPCTALFDQQPQEYRDQLLANKSLKVVIEAGLELSWSKYLQDDGIFFGMNGFGLSGKAEDLYRHFGLTSENIVTRIMTKLGK